MPGWICTPYRIFCFDVTTESIITVAVLAVVLVIAIVVFIKVAR